MPSTLVINASKLALSDRSKSYSDSMGGSKRRGCRRRRSCPIGSPPANSTGATNVDDAEESSFVSLMSQNEGNVQFIT